jgi:hypothetical protein
MRRPIERLALALALLAIAGPARGQTPYDAPDLSSPALVAAPAPPTPRPFVPALRLELGGSLDGPLGSGAVDVTYAPLRWLSLGAGIGLDGGQSRNYVRYGAFARGHLLRRGPLVAGPVLTASMGSGRDREEVYQRPQYTPDHLTFHWDKAFRLDAGVGAELRGHGFSLRLEAGVGYVLDAPTCSYTTEATVFVGACNAPQIPSYYHFSIEPGRVASYVSLTVGAETGDRAPPSRESAPEATPEVPEAGLAREARETDARVDSAWAAPTALTQPKGTMSFTLYELVLPNITVGVTDRLQVDVGIGDFFFARNGLLLWDAEAKFAVGESGRAHFALFAGAGGIGSGGLYAYGAGPVASVCIDLGCESVLSTSVVAGGLHINTEDGPPNRAGVIVSPSAVVALARHLKLVGELHWVVESAKPPFWLAAARVPWGPIAIDAGVLEGKVPVGSATVRW